MIIRSVGRNEIDEAVMCARKWDIKRHLVHFDNDEYFVVQNYNFMLWLGLCADTVSISIALHKIASFYPIDHDRQNVTYMP